MEDRELEEIFGGADGIVMNGEDADYPFCREFPTNDSALVYLSGRTGDVHAKETESAEETDVLILNFEYGLMNNFGTAGVYVNQSIACEIELFDRRGNEIDHPRGVRMFTKSNKTA